MSKRFEISDILSQGSALLQQAAKTLADSGDEFSDLVQRVPPSMKSDNQGLSIAFAGQYSAGKSSLLSVLTDRNDIGIGAGITTQHAEGYDWNGLKIFDTPGVHTGVRADHDAATYQALSEADLIVFVTTNELFDDHIATHFRKLAIDQGKAHEMLLVVNKMQRHALGNTPEAQAIVAEGLAEMVQPFSTESLYLCCVDAQSALKSRAEQNPKLAEIYWRKSGIDQFIERLNQFVRDKGMLSRFTTALYTLEQVLQEALSRSSTSDPASEGLQELLMQQRRAFVDERSVLPSLVRKEVAGQVERIREDGRHIASCIDVDVSESTINEQLAQAQERAEATADLVAEAVRELLVTRSQQLEQRITQIVSSDFAKKLMVQLEKIVAGYQMDKPLDPVTMVHLKHASANSTKLAKFLVDHSYRSTDGSLKAIFQLKNYSGTTTHDVVLTVGKFFGKKFKPWEAIKWTKNIAHVGRGLAVVGAALTIYLTWREDVNEANQLKDVTEVKNSVRNNFNEAANAIETHYDVTTQSYVADSLEEPILQIDQRLKELQDMQESRTIQYDALRLLLDQTSSLIDQIHQAPTGKIL